ncbi:MAG: N-acetylmuramoyl-L-alanine amidase [Synergistetes bacterium ADurb.BinA166]|nr:MAG: N-acetylmuramoyl-L-alanine amidase [Synergistetes bacterium ADurb.BinA166]
MADDNPYLSESEMMIVGGVPVAPPEGVSVKNFLDPTVHRFVNKKMVNPVTEFVVHETVSRSWKSTVDTLRPKSASNPGGRGLGVHLIAGPDGTMYQHGDLSKDLLWHASQHNEHAIGVEVVNPYEPRLNQAALPWKDVIQSAPWAHGSKYLVPTPEQSEAVARTITWVTSPDSGLSVPRIWVGLHGSVMAMGSFPAAAKVSPGIYAHHYFGHADGAWLVLYSWLRIEGGLCPQDARREAIKLATGARASGVDVSPYMKK